MNKRAWLKIFEAFIAVFIIIFVALVVINTGYIEKRDVSEKIYDVEVELLDEIIEEFGKKNLDDNTINDFIMDEEKRRVPEYLTCIVEVCELEEACEIEQSGTFGKDVYVQSLPIIEEDTLLRIFCVLQ